MNFKTKPRGEQASFATECVRCRGELTISNGRIDFHECQECQERRPVIYAEHEEVPDWRATRHRILDRLEAEMNNR